MADGDYERREGRNREIERLQRRLEELRKKAESGKSGKDDSRT